MLDLALAMSLSESDAAPLDLSAPILSETGADLQRRLSGNAPAVPRSGHAQQASVDEDAALARRLQDEEDAAAAATVRTAMLLASRRALQHSTPRRPHGHVVLLT